MRESYVFTGLLLIGVAVGFAIGQLVVGTLVGVGVGLVVQGLLLGSSLLRR